MRAAPLPAELQLRTGVAPGFADAVAGIAAQVFEILRIETGSLVPTAMLPSQADCQTRETEL